VRCVLVALGLVAVALALPAGAQEASFSPSDPALRAAVCPARGRCEIESVVPAGRHGATEVAVVRVRSGPAVCCDEPAYVDRLVTRRAGVVRSARVLSRGRCPCLEWQRSSWAYRRGELLFTYGGMGAPPARSTDMRPVVLHVRPWPLAVTGAFQGDDALAEAPALPIVLTME
jgi:hypothetical protein